MVSRTSFLLLPIRPSSRISVISSRKISPSFYSLSSSRRRSQEREMLGYLEWHIDCSLEQLQDLDVSSYLSLKFPPNNPRLTLLLLFVSSLSFLLYRTSSLLDSPTLPSLPPPPTTSTPTTPTTTNSKPSSTNLPRPTKPPRPTLLLPPPHPPPTSPPSPLLPLLLPPRRIPLLQRARLLHRLSLEVPRRIRSTRRSMAVITLGAFV